MHGSIPQGISDTPREASLQVWEDVKQHSAKPRLNSELQLLDSIRAARPDEHVILASKESCDLLGFAKSGAATAKLQTDRRDYQAFRKYYTSGKRIDDKAALIDKVKWGCFDYQWNEHRFTIYKHEYYERYQGTVTNFYICYPASPEEISTGKCEAIDALLWDCGKWSQLLHDEIYVFDGGYWNKSEALWNSVKDASWDDVILDPRMKSHVKEDVEGFFSNRELYKDLAVPWKRGIILHGHPGNGKTITIKALIGSLYARKDQIPSLYVKSIKSCNGKEYCIREIFSLARKLAPCLLIFEDLDSLVTNDVRSYFLNEVDGLESNDGILMIGSTNHLDKLDPAIAKRPSRFDRKYHFKLPGEAERMLYCDFWKNKASRSKLVHWPEGASEYIAKLTEGFSFAYMKELFVMTLLNVARGTPVPKAEPTAEAEKSKSDEDATAAEVKELVEQVKELILEVKKFKNEGKPADGENKEEKKEETKSSSKPKRKVADVPVPDELLEHKLIAHIRHHVQLLLDDMDNSDDEVTKPTGSAGGYPDYYPPGYSMDEDNDCDDCN